MNRELFLFIYRDLVIHMDHYFSNDPSHRDFARSSCNHASQKYSYWQQVILLSVVRQWPSRSCAGQEACSIWIYLQQIRTDSFLHLKNLLFQMLISNENAPSFILPTNTLWSLKVLFLNISLFWKPSISTFHQFSETKFWSTMSIIFCKNNGLAFHTGENYVLVWEMGLTSMFKSF